MNQMNLRTLLHFVLHPFLPLILLTAVVVTAPNAEGTNWPQFLGPARNGTYPTDDRAASWPKDGPSKVWERKIGQGFSAPVLANGRLILFHRVSDQETVECLDPKNGQTTWKF